MADKLKDGGPAFPPNAGWRDNQADGHGMTLRDWFAGQALAGFSCTANEELPMEVGESIDAAMSRYWGAQAKTAYIAADAMIAAREAR